MRKVNKAGIDLIKEFEGCELRAYQDSVGVWTIGYGHIVGVKRGDRITQADADRIFETDINIFAKGVDDVIDNDVSDNEFAACVALAFNIGIAAFKRSSVLRALNRGDFQSAADHFLDWNKGKVRGKMQVINGLTRRRKAERKLFLTPDADDTATLSDPLEPTTNNIRNTVAGASPTSEGSDGVAPVTQTVEATGTGTQVNIQPDSKPVVSTDPATNVFELASTGFGKVSQKLTAGTISTGFFTAIASFFQNNWVGIVAGVVLAIFLIGCGVALFMWSQKLNTDKKMKEAEIRSNPELHNIKI